MKRTLSVILSALMILCFCTTASATEVSGGEINDTSLTWSFDNGVGILYLSGTGMMPSYESAVAPWHSYIGSIQAIVINDGVDNISASAFADCPRLTSVVLPKSSVSIDETAFSNCTSLEAVYGYYGRRPSGIDGDIFIAVDSIPYGDLNCDYSIDTSDYVLLKRAVLGTYEIPIPIAHVADCDKSGGIDSTDYTLLKRAVLGTYYLPSIATYTRNELFVASRGFLRSANEYPTHTAPILTESPDSFTAEYAAKIVYNLNLDEYYTAAQRLDSENGTVLFTEMPIEAVSETALDTLGCNYDFTAMTPYSEGTTQIGVYYNSDAGTVVVIEYASEPWRDDKLLGGYGGIEYIIKSATCVEMTVAYSVEHQILDYTVYREHIGTITMEKLENGNFRFISFEFFDEPIVDIDWN